MIVFEAVGPIYDAFEVVSNIANPADDVVNNNVHKLESLFGCIGYPILKVWSEVIDPSDNIISNVTDVSLLEMV